MVERSGPARLLKVALVALLAAFSTGWVLPLYLASNFLVAGVEHVKLGDQALSSYPFFPDAQRQLLIGAVWLGTVIFFWIFVACYRLFVEPGAGRER